MKSRDESIIYIYRLKCIITIGVEILQYLMEEKVVNISTLSDHTFASLISVVENFRIINLRQ